MSKSLLFIIIFFQFSPLFAQFTDMGNLGLPPTTASTSVNISAFAWGDYDNDGYLDIAAAGVEGNTFTRIYHNNQNGTFTDINATLTGLEDGTIDWGDYNNDGYIDLIVTGSFYDSSLPNGGFGEYSKIYKNNGNGTFTDINAGLAGLRYGSTDWGDYDNDGDLDLILTGGSSSGITKIYRNDGNDTFTEILTSIPGRQYGKVTWVDYDNDGDLDVLIGGNAANGSSSATTIYRNDQNNTFTATSISLPAVTSFGIDVGDYDSDGDMDIILCSTATNNKVVKVYKNNGNGSFTDISASIINAGGYAKWGDYDGDGDLDILLNGYYDSWPNSAYITKIYRNDGSNTFTDISMSVTGINGTNAWVDYDNDGDLDFMVVGTTGVPANYSWNYLTKIFRNNSTTANTAPSAPTNIQTIVTGGTATLSWNKATDGQTPQNGLTYNLRIGSSSGGIQIMSPMANISNGRRRIVSTGNVGQKTSFTISSLPTGTYYWSVQAIDNSFAGSSFSTEGTFTISVQTPTVTTANISNITLISASGGGNVTSENGASVSAKGIVWGTSINPTTTSNLGITNDGTGSGSFTSSITSLSPGTTYYVRAYATNSVGTSYGSQVSFTTLYKFTNLNLGLGTFDDIEWGDYDGDGDLDLLASGGGTIKLFKNNGSNSFSEVTTTGIMNVLTGLYYANCEWGDYDNDGDLDIFLTGSQNTYPNYSPITAIFTNNGNGTFSILSMTFNYLYSAYASWEDYNNDGYLDIIYSGSYYQYGYPNSTNNYNVYLYKNNGDGTFSVVSNNDAGLNSGSNILGDVEWGDYDNDGYLDYILAGVNYSIYGTGAISTKLLHNNGDGTFSAVSTNIANVYNGSVKWGDYDSDGDLDILIFGASNNSTPYNEISKIYRNDGSGSFTDITAGLAGFYGGRAEWGDYDNDGDLDVLLIGNSGSSRATKLYQNDGSDSFSLVSSTNLPAVNGNCTWGDSDDDGDLDIAFSSGTIYKNIFPSNPNTLPTAPSSLQAVQSGTQVNFSWNKSTDSETSQNGLTYNIRLGTTPSGIQKFSPSSVLSTGKRKIVKIGNRNMNNSLVIDGLTSGTYYWSVQAVDNNYAGSAFPTEQSFSVHIPSITTSSVSNITATTAVCGGNVTAENGSPVTAKGVVWETSSGPTVASHTGITNDGSGTGGFVSTLTGLTPGARYYVRSYATNSAGSYYGTEKILYTKMKAPGNALRFDANTYFNVGPCVDIGYGSTLNITSLTVEAWINPDVVNTMKAILGNYFNSEGWLFVIAATGELAFYQGYVSVTTSGAGIQAGVWQHVACTVSNNTIKFYVNGILVHTGTVGSFTSPTFPFGIGATNGNRYNNAGYYYRGKIDELRIWNTARTETQIRNNMHKVITGTENNLVAYYTFDYLSGGTLTDLTGNSNDGSLINMTTTGLGNSWITSTAPIGNDNNVSSGGSNLTATPTVPVGINWTTSPGTGALYTALEIKNTPSTTTNLLTYVPERYWMIDLVNSSSFAADVTFAYDSLTGISDESALSLYTRSNFGQSWTAVPNCTINSGASNTDGIGSITASGLTHFSQFIVSSNSNPLPVELNSFSAVIDKDKVKLNWTTATEENNYGFSVERYSLKDNSVDTTGNDLLWEEIGFVKGHGNSNSPKTYKFTDKPEFAGKIQYRLKQIDTDGKFKFSDKVEVNLSAPESFGILQNFPNPYNPTTVIKFKIPKTSRVTLIVYDILGRMVRELINEKRTPGFYSVEFNASNLPSGIYIYRITAGKFTQTKKMILLK